MSGENLFRDLSWLPRAGADASALFADLSRGDRAAGALAKAIAAHALDDNELNRLAGVLRTLRTQGLPAAPLAPVKMGIAASSTTEFSIASIEGTAPRHGLAIECIDAGFGQAAQAALDPNSVVQRARPDFVLIALDADWLLGHSAAAADDAARSALEPVRSMLAGFRDGCGATCIVQTIPHPVESLFGSFDRSVSSSRREVFERFNHRLAALAKESGALLVDIADLAANVGLAEWHDPALWNLAKVPVAASCLPAYGEWICRVVAAARGKSRKCLVLDLDNTLWGGVVGDDGIDALVIGAGDVTGEAHFQLQQLALDLRDRGVLLAVCSKNDEALARQALREHPQMLLREAHFAAFRANWMDKAANLRAIAEDLAIGLDSLVFVDDNPAERALIRRELPEVAVPELPEDPAMYPRTLAAAGYFEAVSYSDEDSSRAEAYTANAHRASLRACTTDLDAYLRSLRMQIRLAPFDAASRARIAQLINKSNQFNLTTRRYTEAQIAQLEAETACQTLQVHLKDAFGDNGMISVVICRRRDDDWEIDTWLMSCRVLGRKVEDAVLQDLVRRGARLGIRRLVGEFIPSGRNALVESHYPALGFTLLARAQDGATRWELPLAQHVARELPFTVQGG